MSDSQPPLPASSDDLGAQASSQVSLGFLPDEEAYPGSSSVGLRPSQLPRTTDKDDLVRDHCCMALYCQQHDKFLLALTKGKGHFLPSMPFRLGQCDTASATKWIGRLLKNVLGRKVPISGIQLLDMSRVQVPQKYPSFSTRFTFMGKISCKSAEQVCGCNLPIATRATNVTYKWFALDEIKQQDTLWGPEPCKILRTARANFVESAENSGSKSQPKVQVTLDESDCGDIMDQFASKAIDFLRSARFDQDILHKLHNEFVMQCLPAKYMSFWSFRVYMHKLGWFNEDDSLLKRIFGTFLASSPEKRSPQYLTFAELAIGLAAMEETADNRANNFSLRLDMIFHFYDADRNGKLDMKELTIMAQDIVMEQEKDNQGRPQQVLAQSSDIRNNTVFSTRSHLTQCDSTPSREDKVAKLVNQMCLIMSKSPAINEQSSISRDQFNDGVKSCQWLAEPIERLFRSNRSTVKESTKFDFNQSPDRIGLLRSQIALTGHNHEPCDRCHETRFSVCSHGIRIDEYGRIWSTIKFDLSKDFADVSFKQEVKVKLSTFDWIALFSRYVSQLALDKQSARPIKGEIGQVLRLVKEALKAEPLVVHLGSPCLVFGQVLSNVGTLHHLKTLVDRCEPFVTPHNLVFLGNFIDMNHEDAMDTAIYLLCLKSIMPKRVTLLRGQNELCDKLNGSKFHQDCVIHYGGNIWQQMMDIFDCLPCAAIVDKALFLTSSGIPLDGEAIDANKQKHANSKEFINCLLKGKPMGHSTGQGTDHSAKSKSLGLSNSSSDADKVILTKPLEKVLMKIKVKKGSTASLVKSKVELVKSSIEPTVSKESAIQLTIVPSGFTLPQLRHFKRVNHFSHIIRSEMLANGSPYQLADQDSLITLGAIGKQATGHSKTNKLVGSIALVNRFKIRLIRLETIIGPGCLF